MRPDALRADLARDVELLKGRVGADLVSVVVFRTSEPRGAEVLEFPVDQVPRGGGPGSTNVVGLL
jgi:hypothetical protein